MTPLMVKGVLFGLLLLSAAVWDMRNREIPNLIPALLLLHFKSEQMEVSN